MQCPNCGDYDTRRSGKYWLCNSCEDMFTSNDARPEAGSGDYRFWWSSLTDEEQQAELNRRALDSIGLK